MNFEAQMRRDLKSFKRAMQTSDFWLIYFVLFWRFYYLSFIR